MMKWVKIGIFKDSEIYLKDGRRLDVEAFLKAGWTPVVQLRDDWAGQQTSLVALEKGDYKLELDPYWFGRTGWQARVCRELGGRVITA